MDPPAEALALAGGLKGVMIIVHESSVITAATHCDPSIYSPQYVVLPIHVITHMAR